MLSMVSVEFWVRFRWGLCSEKVMVVVVVLVSRVMMLNGRM